MNYDFIEIGTYFRDTLDETLKPGQMGMAVEPMSEYLSKLPDLPNLTKVNAAIVPSHLCIGGVSEQVIYYIPLKVVKELGLPSWLAQCNSIGAPHPKHAGMKDLVQTRKVLVYSYPHLLYTHRVTRLQHLKIDAEGMDCGILMDMLTFAPVQARPETILFETNEPSLSHEYVTTFRALCKAGYVLTVQEDNNTKAVKAR